MRFDKPLTLGELAQLTGGKAIGNLSQPITGINEIHVAGPGDVTFVDHPKYYDRALSGKASAILINALVDCPEDKGLILVEDPFAAFVQLIVKFRPFLPSNSLISPTATIGEGTIIQPSVFIGNYVSIGRNCIIHSGVVIYDHCVIGDEVIIHGNSVIGSDGYYFQKRPDGYRKLESGGRVVIGNRVEIGALCSIDRGVTSDTIIDDGTKMDNHCQVGHDTYIGKNCLIGAHAAIAGVTRIEDDVVLWGRVAVNKDIVIGKGAIVLATSAVDKSIEGGGKVYFGAPAEEAMKKWRELAAVRQLPRMLKKLQNLDLSYD